MSEVDIQGAGSEIQHEREARGIASMKVKNDPMTMAMQQEQKVTSSDWSCLEGSSGEMSLRR